MRRTGGVLVTVFAFLFLGLGFLVPLGLVLRNGFLDGDGRPTFDYLVGVFRNPIYTEGLCNSLLIAGGTTLLALLVSLPLAWIGHRYRFPGKEALSVLLLVPMVLPPFVGAIGFQKMFGLYGALNAYFGLEVDWLGRGRAAGVVLLQAFSLYPVLYLNLAAALANIDPAMEEAAVNLGARGWTRFRRISLPLMMPGLFAGGTIVFIWSFTELGTPLILNYTRCASVQVYDALKEIGGNPFAYALVSVMLAVSVGSYALGRALFGSGGRAMAGKTVTLFAERPLQGGWALLAASPFVLVVCLALLPHIGVLLTSFSAPGGWYRSVLPEVWTTAHYAEALAHGMTVGSIRNSLFFSVMAVTVNLCLGIAIAFVVVRSSLRARGLLDGLAMLPMAVPGLVMAAGYLGVSAWASNTELVRESLWLRGLLDVKTNPTLFLVLAYSVRRLPYMVRAAAAGLQQTSAGLEEAAANLGAGPLTSLRRVTLPLIAANLVAGALLSFAFSMLEVSDSLMLAQRADHYPITKTIYELFQLIGTGKHVAAALGVWAMVFLALTLAGSRALLGRKMGALFRV